MVVLMHELIHGYTHIGFDKDGNSWDTLSFDNADLRIVEGFAEYYSELICLDYFDFALPAFYALHEKASEEYTAYKEWFSSTEKDKYEKARRLLLTCRSNNIINYDHFMHELDKVRIGNS
jgi:hypothetical protein